jgi:signal transduction histidine kinase
MVSILSQEPFNKTCQSVFFDETGRAELFENLRLNQQSLEHQINERTQELQTQVLKNRDLHLHYFNQHEQERRYLAHELHDDLGQALSAIRLDASFILQQWGKSQPELTKLTVDITQLVDNMIDKVRRITSILRPAALVEG